MTEADIYADINRELIRQREHPLHPFDQDFDDKHTADTWGGLIASYATRNCQFKEPPETWRDNMIKAAALCVAAIYQHDTRGFTPKHWESPSDANTGRIQYK